MDPSEDDLGQDFDLSNCFPINETGFAFKKNLLKLDNKKLSGTIAFRLKTSVTKALLKENANDNRKLQKDVSLLHQHKQQHRHAQNNLQLNFRFHQLKKRETWQRDDRTSLDRFNFPTLHAGDRKLKSASVSQVYRTPDNMGRPGVSVPLFPVMYGEVEPRIVEHRSYTYLTKEPIAYELNEQQQKRYNHYRGTDLLRSRAVRDKRFERLSEVLSDVKNSIRTKRGDNSQSKPVRRDDGVDEVHSLPNSPLQAVHHNNHRRGAFTRAATTFT